MKKRLILSFIFSTIILDLVSGYSYSSKQEDKEDENDAWHTSREGYKKEPLNNDDEVWPGRWLPSRPEDPTPPPKVLHQIGEFRNPNFQKSSQHSVGMGVQSGGCDDGQSNLEVDWDGSPINYTCYQNKIEPSYSIAPIVYCEHIPHSYSAIHKCMTQRIEYDNDIPIYGTHRPVWPVYGEYKFVPKQRWLHSLEHGAIVMLYHPCANPTEVNRLKKLVAGCLRRHIISPYTLLNEDRPLALVSWGCRLTMSYVNPSVVQKFITSKALRGKEEIPYNGGFNQGLIQESETVTDEEDTTLCPGL